MNNQDQINELYYRPNLRFPNIDLKSYHDDVSNVSYIKIYTFLNKGTKCIKHYSKYEIQGEIKFEDLNHFHKRFKDECNNIINNYILHDELISEPFSFNIKPIKSNYNLIKDSLDIKIKVSDPTKDAKIVIIPSNTITKKNKSIMSRLINLLKNYGE